jgi:hypothetical protein
MKLRVDVRKLLAVREPGSGPAPDPAPAEAFDLDLRRLPWSDASFAAIELDDVPAPSEWTLSGPALNEVRRILRRNGFLEVRTRRVDARTAQATQKDTIGAMTRLLQNHGFDVVCADAVEDGGSMVSAMALRRDGPEDVFEDQTRQVASHVTLHAPLLEASDASASNRALAVSLDAQGVRIRVRVIFDVLDALYND